MLFKGSRYANVPIGEMVDPLGRTLRYLRTRVTPASTVLTGHVVDDGERLDHIAFRHLRDAERFWRICDANFAMRPEDLVETPGRMLGIPSSEE